VNDLQQMLQQLQTIVDNLSESNQQLSDEIASRQSDIEVAVDCISCRVIVILSILFTSFASEL